MFVTAKFHVACVGTDSASLLRLQHPLCAGIMFPKEVFSVFAKNWDIRV